MSLLACPWLESAAVSQNRSAMSSSLKFFVRRVHSDSVTLKAGSLSHLEQP